jgi:ABC-2 type transport system ATP-binding protein
MDMHAIEIEGLGKSYGDLHVLRGVNLRVVEGEVYGLLGPNGTGKSTLLHLLLGFLRPSAGTIALLGERDLDAARGRVGYLPERLRYHTRYSAREYLRFLGQFSDMGGATLRQRVDEELERVGLADAADRLLATFSKGMLQRLGIAQALLANPELLLIDEPTSGLDPSGQREMLDLLAALRAQGRTILLTTHTLAEIEQVCDRVGVLTGGRVDAEANVRDLRGPGASVSVLVEHLQPEQAAQLGRISPAVRSSDREIVLSPNSHELQAMVLRKLLDMEVPIMAVQPQSRPLEQFYLQAVRGDLAPPGAEPPAPPTIAPRAEPQPARPEPQLPPVRPPAPVAAPLQPGEGDTLLNELLRRDRNGDE